jgi:quercetin dioxygenase-like cupin family protein
VVRDMTVQRWEAGQGQRRQAAPGAPVAEVVIGTGQGTGVGVVDVTVPAGAAMPEHAHGDSETLLIPQAGRLRLVDAESGAVTELEPGVLATIPIGRRVSLENPEATDARMLVVLSPPDFAAAVAAWPVVA